MAIFFTVGSSSTCKPRLRSSSDEFGAQSTILPMAYEYSVPGSVRPAASSCFGIAKISGEKYIERRAILNLREKIARGAKTQLNAVAGFFLKARRNLRKDKLQVGRRRHGQVLCGATAQLHSNSAMIPRSHFIMWLELICFL